MIAIYCKGGCGRIMSVKSAFEALCLILVGQCARCKSDLTLEKEDK
jgi:hypothetical protein